MTGRTATRLNALEASSPQGHAQAHRLIWETGQAFDDMLDRYGRDCIGKNDFVIIRECVEPGPPDPIHVRDEPKYRAWEAERQAAQASGPGQSRRRKGKL